MMKTIECSSCGLLCKVSEETTKIICSDCVIDSLVKSDKRTTTKRRVGYPKGWRFMKEFVHSNGTVYHRGVEQPELKGTLQPTVIDLKPKVNRKDKKEKQQSLLEEYANIKKQLKKEKRKTVRKKLELRLNKLAKLI